MELRVPTSEDEDRLLDLIDRVGRDGEEALSEYKLLHRGDAGVSREIVGSDERVVVYAQAAWHPPGPGVSGRWAVEVVAEERGAAVAAVRVVTDGLSPWGMWTRRPLEEDVATDLGLRPVRAVLRLGRDLPITARARVPGDIMIAAFRPGRDEESWLATHRAAFAGHPEAAAIDRHELARRMRAPWWDPKGLIMAWSDGELLGSCWTKVRPDGCGEIYIIGVAPSAQGRGLGRLLTVEGLRHLHDERGVGKAILWVEADNAAARHVYATLGFAELGRTRWWEP